MGQGIRRVTVSLSGHEVLELLIRLMPEKDKPNVAAMAYDKLLEALHITGLDFAIDKRTKKFAIIKRVIKK